MNPSPNLTCNVCGGNSSLFDVVDFNKSCEEEKGFFLSKSGIPIYYTLCDSCGFCCAPEIASWQIEEFENKIYNDEYIKVDPDYVDLRTRSNATNLIEMFKQYQNIKHLDYGGGDGLLSTLLCEAGFDSSSYDPFVNKNVNISEVGTFDLITAFEVFEHVPDVHSLIANLTSLVDEKGIILFSTLLTDGNIVKNNRLTWWYAAPRNGHISLFSRSSLSVIAHQYGFNFGSFNQGFHAFWKTIPTWASHLIK
jgi:hypothetical protein